jgi:F420-dependent oxidoreductase-like protein
MKIGLQIPNFTWPGGPAAIGTTLAGIAGTADSGGFHSLWVMDHFFQIGDRGHSRGLGPAEDEMLEGYSTLAYLAAHTKNVRLGTLVTGVVYRHPGILVKTVTTLDVLSGGRAWLGIGAAWNQREADGLGVPFPPLGERFERLEETIRIALQMWSGGTGRFDGKYFQLAETLCRPLPLSKPHPPILIGGQGERKTLLLAAKYADACNLFEQIGDDALRAKLDVLRRHCDSVGRDYAQIEKTTLASIRIAPGHQSAREVVERCRELAALGFQHVIFNMPTVHDIAPLQIIAREIIPAAAGF